jgi:23S rRNA (pseudouridine1915-N3)-methyltransferase
MKVEIIAVGKLKEAYDLASLSEYKKRLSGFCDLIITEIKEVTVFDEHPSSIELTLQQEAILIEKKLSDKAFIVALDIQGKMLNSEGFENIISENLNKHHHFIFIIGSAWGLAQSIKDKAHLRWSFSSLTFPHTMMRLMVLEQIYRAFKIQHHHPYHK